MDIFVGSLPFKLKESELREVFEKFGEVTSVTLIIDKITRQNKGFGFVVMPDDKQARDAIELLNGTELKGRTIKVSKSEEKKEERGKSRAKGKPEGKYENPKEEGKVKGKEPWKAKSSGRKKTDNVIGRYDDDERTNKKKEVPAKLAKNFKVGGKRKRK